MANTYPFPSAGAVGIGTTTPLAPLHVLSGSAELALFQGNPMGSERAYIQITSSNSNTWQISNQDANFGNTANGLAFVESTGTESPAIRVYFQQGGNVGVGVTSNGSARFAVANSGGTSVVQLQASGSASGLMPALSLGYGATYDAVAIHDAAYIQADNRNLSSFPALLVSPLGGAVLIGYLTPEYGTVYAPSDQYPAGTPVPRFSVNQYLSSGNANGNAMASYSIYTVAPAPADQSAASYYGFISGGAGGGSGDAGLRAIEARTFRYSAQHSASVTQGIYLTLNSQVSGNGLTFPPQNLGMYVRSYDLPAYNDAAVYITGADGWYLPIMYDDGFGAGQFWVAQYGDMYAARGGFEIDPSGDVLTNGTFGAINAVNTYPGVFSVAADGSARAVNFSTISARALKKDIAPLSSEAAAGLLDGLDPVRFRFKQDDVREYFGFIAEDTPRVLAPEGAGVSLFDLMAVLARVAKDHREEIEQQRGTNQGLWEKLELLEKRLGGGGGAKTPSSGA